MKTSKRVETRDARKRSKKTSKKVERLTCPLFSWLRVPETTVFMVFSAPLENQRRKKPNLSLFTKTPSQKKMQKKRHICALVAGSENTIFVVVSRGRRGVIMAKSQEGLYMNPQDSTFMTEQWETMGSGSEVKVGPENSAIVYANDDLVGVSTDCRALTKVTCGIAIVDDQQSLIADLILDIGLTRAKDVAGAILFQNPLKWSLPRCLKPCISHQVM